jgi:N-acetylglucosamine kinase-like BadF-type ATPase
MFLIADSGSTKTDWCLCNKGAIIQHIQTQGINPYHQSEDAIEEVLREELLPQLKAQSSHLNAQSPQPEVIFYGSGCANETACKRVEEAIYKVLGTDHITIHSDLFGAARALCGREEGIACVLGTGSNSCLYNGKEIVANIPPLGYILGDEGSSAVLGRRLVGDCLKNQLPETLRDEFLTEYNLTQEIILEKVYRQPLANRFLASLTPFLSKHREVPGIHKLLVESFTDFFVRNVKQYRRPWLPIHFVGSIAHAFSAELKEAAESLGMELGTILQSPMEGLIKYHTEEIM